MPNLYQNLADFKTRLGVTGTSDDAATLSLLENVARMIDAYCNRFFFTRHETRYYDGRLSPLMLDQDLYAVTTLKTDDNHDGTYESTWAAADYILLPYHGYPKYGVAVDRRSTGSKADFANGLQKAVEVAAEWGWERTTQAGSTVNEVGFNTTDTTLTVTSGAAFKTGQTILIESEQLYISAISGNDLTVQRGVNGTTAAAHANTTAITIITYPLAIAEAAQQQAALLWQRRTAPFTVQTTTLRGPQADLDPQVRSLMQPFRRAQFAAI